MAATWQTPAAVIKNKNKSKDHLRAKKTFIRKGEDRLYPGFDIKVSSVTL